MYAVLDLSGHESTIASGKASAHMVPLVVPLVVPGGQSV